jgi:Xaa-Pro aminopeptidase
MPGASRDRLAARIAGVREASAAQDLHALVVTHLPNIRYLTNFAGSAAVVVVTADRLYFITDFRYVEAVEATLASRWGCPDATLVRVEGSYDETLAALISGLASTRIAFEAARLPVSRYLWLASVLGIPDRLLGDIGSPGSSGRALVPTERLVERLRLRKDDDEIETLRAAARLISDLTGQIFGEVRAGRTEREVAASLDWHLTQGGFDRPAFDAIVASGPNGALPHAMPGSRRLCQGDLIVLDFGGVYDGYFVDITRTVSLGPPGDEACRVHQAVAEAQAVAIAAVRPGVTASSIDAAARSVLAAHGLAEAFGHATGHGLGVELQEEPRIAPVRRPAGTMPGLEHEAAPGDERIEPGMVFTIEPGAYRPGWGGVRIEDDVLVTADGCDVLTTCPRELVVL